MIENPLVFDLDRPPPDEVWANTNVADDDANWARREFEGLTGHQAWKLFTDNVLGAAECIGSMPDEAFKYYVFALAMYTDQLDFDLADEAPAATDCLFGYLEARKKVAARTVQAVTPAIAPVLQKLAANQEANDMPVEIYGDLTLRAHALLTA